MAGSSPKTGTFPGIRRLRFPGKAEEGVAAGWRDGGKDRLREGRREGGREGEKRGEATLQKLRGGRVGKMWRKGGREREREDKRRKIKVIWISK